ncbi:ImmA/IrrE family metallo-endopeptidase, partial [Thiomonas sp. X19]|uniref:ImmA/IrrE family metallo-endopeptidase n=1 Tax=Thiomonas sp. X19 TaxID=1050370 RepID=UPI000DD911AA
LLVDAQVQTVLEREAVKAFPIDPFGIAERNEIIVHAAPSSRDGVSGLLVRRGNSFGILYGTHISSEGFQRFSVAHELGHYFMPGHIEAVLNDGDSHESRAMGATDNPYEDEADAFAASLLMPKPLFASALCHMEDGLAAVEALSSQCKTSLMATANRYADLATIPAAIVVSQGANIDYCKMSPALRNFRGLTWIRRGTPLPPRSTTACFNIDRARVASASKETSLGSLKEWFGGPYDLEVTEEVKGLGEYGRTLTVLSLDTFADELEQRPVEQWSPPTFR